MKRLQSITFLLSALTSLSVVLLVSVFSLSAKEAYDKRHALRERQDTREAARAAGLRLTRSSDVDMGGFSAELQRFDLP